MRRDVGAISGQYFDIVVVGGGMHGAWIALRAAMAGLSVALLERGDFGSATSANSLKILHGGLRYLQDVDLRRMRSSIAARREFARQSPHLFDPLPCLMPLAAGGLRSPWVLGPALALNDLVSGDRNDGVAPRARLPRGGLLSADRMRSEMAYLAERGCVAGARWWDGIARDSGRLALEVVMSAQERGAVVINHLSVERILHTAEGRVHGVAVRDVTNGAETEARARVVVNATGPWAADLARRSGLYWPATGPAFIGGLNLVLRRSLGTSSAVALTAAATASGAPSREFFFVPWRATTLVGTDYCAVPQAALPARFAPSAAIDRFVDQLSRLAPRARVTRSDIALVHWGLLPASAAESRLPARKPYVLAGRLATHCDGIIHVIAEKLTSAPVLSTQVLALAQREAGQTPTRTPRQPSHEEGEDRTNALGSLPLLVRKRLQDRYGRRAEDVVAVAEGRSERLEPLYRGSDVLVVEALHAMRGEMACTLADLLCRRLGLGDAGSPPEAALDACTELAAAELSWSSSRSADERRQLLDWYRANLAGDPD